MSSMRDIFGRRQQEVGAVLAADSLKGVLSIGDDAWIGALVQNIAIQYQAPTQIFHELGSNKSYRLVMRAQGALSIGRILGVNTELPIEEALFDVCNRNGTLTLAGDFTDCSGGITSNFKLTLGGLLASGYNFNVNAQNMLANEGLNFTFNFLGRGI